MMRRFALLAAPLLALATARAQETPPLPPVQVELTTDAGAIVIEVDRARAPVTANNFLAYVDGKRFDGTVFYRSMQLGVGNAWVKQPNGLIQGGTQNEPKRILPAIAHERTDRTGILHKAGAVSMARWAPGTATGDFTIMLSDLTFLDANPADTSDNGAGFAAFGHVVSGMDTVRRIFDAPRSPTKGFGVMIGQMLDPTVKIVRARRVAAPAPVPAK